MLKGISINEKVPFISKKDDPNNNPTIFYIGNIPHEKKMEFFGDAINEDGSMNKNKIQERMLDIALVGLKGIKNLNGKDYDKIDSDAINAIEFDVLGEIVVKIFEFNFVSKDEIKN